MAAGAAAVVLLMSDPARSQSQPTPTGRVVGRVTGEGRAPIASANVIVLGLGRGASTDEDGRYVLDALPVGIVKIQVQRMGYPRQVKTVAIDAGATVTADFAFGEARPVKELPEYEVRGDRNKIDLKGSDTKFRMTGKEISALPVEGGYMGAVALKAGVVAVGQELHVRGGRGDEIKVQHEGVDVTDPLSGRAPSIATLAISGTDLRTGGFDAEFGAALSGVISVSTKEGTDKFGGEVRWDTDRYGDPTKTFNNYDRFTFGVGGPTPIPRLTYYATYEGTFTDTYLKAGRTPSRHTLLDFLQFGFRQNNAINTNFKLAYRAKSSHKFTLETVNNHSIVSPYYHTWSRKGYVQVMTDTLGGDPPRIQRRYGTWSDTQVDSTYVYQNMADHFLTTDDRYQGFTGVWTNQLSEKSVWTTRLAAIRYRTLTSVQGKEPWQYEIRNPDFWAGNTSPGSENNLFFATHGDFPFYLRRDTGTLAFKTDFATRRVKSHTFKTGIEVRYNRVENLSLTQPNTENNGLPGAQRSSFLNFNPEGAAYLQDRWEYEGLVLNAGLRYDVFTPGDQVAISDLPSGRRYKRQVSPRLGIAYPISDRDVLSFHYGRTYQTPSRNFVFENRGQGSAVNVQGNPDLEPETNVAYQAGVQHLFSQDLTGQFSVFFRDIYGLISVRQKANDPDQTRTFVNEDYASARGFEASLVKSFSHKFSAEVNYTFSIATGVASDPAQAQQFFNGGRLYLPISERALDWDQRNTLSLQGVMRDPGRWGMRMLWTYGSGFPFTPGYRNDRRPDPRLENSRRLPSNSSLTVNADKYYKVWGQNVQVFVDARNILDARNIADLEPGNAPNPFVDATPGVSDYRIYYTETGRAGGAYLDDVNGDGLNDWVPVHDPRVFQEGRNVRVGLSVTF
ncbi:MAG TPA: TonB-dependent receptor [Candidatus Eisenbacteria bacterium]|nr:TonB-dependent receptor [Candidatus Eisenbacteria bacterium]